jgi:hypothetical protein
MRRHQRSETNGNDTRHLASVLTNTWTGGNLKHRDRQACPSFDPKSNLDLPAELLTMKPLASRFNRDVARSGQRMIRIG